MIENLFYGLSVFAFLVWGPNVVAMWFGFRRVAKLESFEALSDEGCPRLSIVVPACNEGTTVEAAMRTLLKVDYPRLQIVAIDDRSTDETGAILDRLASEDARLKVLHVTELPAGWLGKNHALQRGSEAANGEWLLFTDADIHYAPSALRRAMNVALASGCDHLVALPRMILEGFWEKVLVGFFGVIFCFRFRPWLAMKRSPRWYVGVGAFNLVKTSTYKALGGHAALRMDVLDDVKLGKLVKEGGFAQSVMTAGPLIAVRWLPGLGGIVRGLEKNAFAGNRYSWVQTIIGSAAILAVVCWPCVGIFIAPLAAKILCSVALAGMLLAGWTLRAMAPAPLLYALLWPLSAMVIAYILLRSAWLAFRQGGIRWRETQYSLEELRENQI